MLKDGTLVIVRENNETYEDYSRRVGIVISMTDMSDFGIAMSEHPIYDVFIDNRIVLLFEEEVVSISGTSTKIIKH